MTTALKVGDIMTKNFVHLKPNASLMDCAKTMIKKRVGSILLKENENIKGIITEKDIVWALTKKGVKNFEEITAQDLATKKVITIKPESTLQEAIEKMTNKKIRRLPVVANKKIIGYITLKDILKFKPSLFESLNEFHLIKEEAEKIERSKTAMKGNFIKGSCEECGNFDVLEEIDGRLICESCRDIM